MKKILFFVALFAGVCVVAIGVYGWNFYSNSTKSSLLFLENVEALSCGESVGGYTRSSGKCSRHVNIKHGSLVSQEARMSAILLTAVDIWGSLVGLNEVLQADFLM